LNNYKDDDYNQDKIDEYLKQGDQVYELYSIVIHAGTASSGHYYAYIKSFEDSKNINNWKDIWYCFNDYKTYEVKIEDIQNSFGKTETGSK